MYAQNIHCMKFKYQLELIASLNTLSFSASTFNAAQKGHANATIQTQKKVKELH